MPVHLPVLPVDVSRGTKVAFDRLKTAHDDLESKLSTLTAQVQAIPPPMTLSQIQAALSASGSNPLNLTGLVGTPQSVATTNTAVRAIPAPPAPPTPAPPTNPGTPTPVVPPPTPTPPGGNSGVDAIPISSVAFINSPNVSAWAMTAKITQLSFSAAGESVAFTKQTGTGRWPDYVPPGFGGPIQFTLWGLFFIGGQWYAAGGILFWYQTPPNVQLNGGNPSQLSAHWFYNSSWSPMFNYQPAVGENVGFMVTAGDARATTSPLTAVLERSNIVLVPFPSDAGAVFTYA